MMQSTMHHRRTNKGERERVWKMSGNKRQYIIVQSLCSFRLIYIIISIGFTRALARTHTKCVCVYVYSLFKRYLHKIEWKVAKLNWNGICYELLWFMIIRPSFWAKFSKLDTIYSPFVSFILSLSLSFSLLSLALRLSLKHTYANSQAIHRPKWILMGNQMKSNQINQHVRHTLIQITWTTWMRSSRRIFYILQLLCRSHPTTPLSN